MNDASVPTLAFGDGDTGLYEIVDDKLSFSIGGVSMVNITDANTTFNGLIYGNGSQLTDITSLTANSSAYWDNLNSPSDITTCASPFPCILHFEYMLLKNAVLAIKSPKQL